MAFIKLSNVYVDFPMLHAEHRSLKKVLFAKGLSRVKALGVLPAERSAMSGRIGFSEHHTPVVRALTDVTLSIAAGERIGLVGRNGAGKTTLLRTLAGIYEPVRGTVETNGRVLSLVDAGLQPEMTGFENIRLRCMLLNMRGRDLSEAIGEVADFSELGEFLHLPVRVYSSGMTMRLAFSMATVGQPEVLLMDEWILAGDAGFLMKAKARMKRFVDQARLIVLASHSEAILRQNCARLVYLKDGHVAAIGTVDEILKEYAAEA